MVNILTHSLWRLQCLMLGSQRLHCKGTCWDHRARKWASRQVDLSTRREVPDCISGRAKAKRGNVLQAGQFDKRKPAVMACLKRFKTITQLEKLTCIQELNEDEAIKMMKRRRPIKQGKRLRGGASNRPSE